MEKNRQHRVLIVPSEEKSGKELAKLFEVCGVACVALENNFKQAGKLLVEGNYDIVVVMDDYDNVRSKDVITFLKIYGESRELRLILHVSSEDSAATRKLVMAGADAVLMPRVTAQSVSVALERCRRVVKPLDLRMLLEQASFFNEFTHEDLEMLMKVAIARRFDAGEQIVAKGDRADCFYILIKGKVMVIIVKQDSTVIDIPVEPGGPFGEMAILDDSPRSAWCVAADDSIVLEIGAYIIRDATFYIRQRLFSKLAIIMAERIRKMNEMLDKHVREGVEQMAAHPAQAHVAQAMLGTSAAPPQPPSVKKKPQRALSDEEREKAKKERARKRREEPLDECAMRQRDLKLGINPYTSPVGVAESYDEEIKTQEEYDVLARKIGLRSDFILGKIPRSLRDMLCNRLFGYWTGSKLSKVNPHHVWKGNLFTPGSPQLVKSLHLVALCSEGEAAFKEVYLNLPFSHRVVGLTEVGCAGTFLGTDEAIERYLNGQSLKSAIRLDMEIPIDRAYKDEDVIEFLTHTTEDVRDETVFLVFDDAKGKNTQRVREKFPRHQIITVVKELGFNFDDPGTMFSMPEKKLEEQRSLVAKSAYQGKGFYQGQTFFLADFSTFYSMVGTMKDLGYIFGTLGALARMGPDYSGVVWGSSGGAEGAVKAARAMFGSAGARNGGDLAAAVNWADGGADGGGA